MLKEERRTGSNPVTHKGRSDAVFPSSVKRSYGQKRSKRFVKRGFLSISDGKILEAALLFWEKVDTPVSLGLYLRARYGLWREIAECRIDPLNYRSARHFQSDYAAVNFLRKYPGLPIAVDRKAEAKKKFLASEDSCAASNIRISRWNSRVYFPIRREVDRVLYSAQSKIWSLLGEVNLDEMSELMRWGPGASSATAGAFVSSYHKFDVAPQCTIGALNYAQAAVNACPTWAQAVLRVDNPVCVLASAFQVIPGNSVTYVPKDALVDRVIAIEPHMNIYMQLGVGGVIRRRLRKVGIDLNDQSRNQDAARDALKKRLATIDLSSASDTIARELVHFLLPPDWRKLLEGLRSVNGELGDGKFFRYEKFSSMGNGFTFELESLIFWALSESVLDLLQQERSSLRVYGDDIVIPSVAYDLLVDVFSFVGFEVNQRKSYRGGLFFESCGKHFFKGVDVTPVYIDSKLTLINELFGLVNQITAFAGRMAYWSGTQDIAFLPVREYFLSLLDKRDRIFGPVGYGDGYIHGDFAECAPFVENDSSGHEGYLFLFLLPKAKTTCVSSQAALPWGLSRLSTRGSEALINRWDRCYDLVPGRKARPLWSTGLVDVRGVPVRFKLARLRVQRPTYVGSWH